MCKEFLLSAVVLLCSTATANATTPCSRAEAFIDATSSWTGIATPLTHTDVTVFLVSRPQQPHSCRVRTAQPDGLVCSRRFRPDFTIPTQNIVAVVKPRDHDDRTLAIWGATGLGFLAAGFFAGPGAPAVWVIGGLVSITWPAAAMGSHNGLEHDKVLYYTPGPQPNVPLR